MTTTKTTNRLTDTDRATLIRVAAVTGEIAAAGIPVITWNRARRVALSAIGCTPWDVRDTELAWLDSVPATAFTAALVDTVAA